MSHMLTKREYLFSREGPTLGANGKTIGYEVLGLPLGEQAWIAEIHRNWQVLRATNVQGDWTGQYRSADEAMAELSDSLHCVSQ